MPLLGRRQPSVLRAAATRVTRGKAKNLQKLTQKWQERALTFYDEIGAIHFSGQFHARAFTNLRLFPALLDENGEPQETDNAKARQILDRVQDPNGGRSSMLGTYGRLNFLIGDSRLIMTIEDGEEKWEVVSPDELRLEQDGKSYRRLKAPGLDAQQLAEVPDDAFEPVEGQVLVYRLWRRHPRYSEWADSSLRGVLADCEEYLRLSRAVRTRSLSRISGPGILFMPDEITFPPPEAGGDEDYTGFDQFGDDLTEALTASIADEESAAAWSPMLVRAKGEFIEKVRLLKLREEELYPEIGMRNECLKRMATGVDMPSAVLLGLEDSNHWSAFIINDETWTAHLLPASQQLVDDLTTAYFRPACKNEGVADWARMVVGFDPAEVINHPNRGEDAQDAFDRGGIDYDTYLEAKGFEAKNRPSREEVALMVAVKTGDLAYIVSGIPSTAVEIAPVPDGGGGDGPTDGSQVDESAPEAPPAEPPKPVTASAHVDRIVGAAEVAVGRARELAGARLRTSAHNGCDDCRALLLDVSQDQVAAILGRERVRDLKAPAAEELVGGAIGPFLNAMRQWGYDQTRAGLIARLVEQHAARTLFDERPSQLPAGFAGYVKRITAEQLAA